MRFPHFTSRKKVGSVGSEKERVFAEASDLAHARLKQCIADLRARPASVNETEDPRGRTVPEEKAS